MLMEDGSGLLENQKTYAEMQKTKKLIERKPDKSLICSRCHQLKNQNKLLEVKAPERTEAGQAVQLADSVTNFDREGIMKQVFK